MARARRDGAEAEPPQQLANLYARDRRYSSGSRSAPAGQHSASAPRHRAQPRGPLRSTLPIRLPAPGSTAAPLPLAYGRSLPGLSQDWGSCRDGCWRMRIVGGLEALPEADAERAVVDGAADLEQPVGPAPGPAPLLRLGHAAVHQEVGRALGQ